jgi:hypothetical protein
VGLHVAANSNVPPPPPLLLLLLLQVDFTEPYMRNFKNLANPNLQEIVANAVERLARGKWPSNMLPHAAVPEQYKAIIQVFWVEGLCVIWMVDVDRDTRKQVGD